jgi:hypothetical protein
MWPMTRRRYDATRLSAFVVTMAIALFARAQSVPADGGATSQGGSAPGAPDAQPPPAATGAAPSPGDAGAAEAADAAPLVPSPTTIAAPEDAGAPPAPHLSLAPTERQLKETAPFVDMPEAAPPHGAPPTAPKDARPTPGYLAGFRELPSISLSPYAPLGYWPSLGIAPVFGSHPPDSGFRFEVHGYINLPLRVGIGSRPNPGPGQNSTTLHGDPVLPGASYGWFDMTPTMPYPYAQSTFVIGNDVVKATASLGAWNISESMTASTYFQNPAQQWFAQGFVDYTPKTGPISVKIRAGAYPERYGSMGQYDVGAYAAPLIAYVRGAGATATVVFPFEYDLDLKLEAGFKGDLNHPPTGLAPSPSNNFASASQGATFAGHAHASLTYQQLATLSLHYIGGFEHDDRVDNFDDPSTTQTNEAIDRADSRLDVVGTDLTVNGGRFGYFYLGAVKSNFHSIEHINDLVQILNTGSGKLLMQRYLGQQGHGNGGLLLLGTQYTVSLGTLLRYPTEFWGEGPDLLVSVFGMLGSTSSDDPTFDGRKMLKYGTELTYSVLPWLAVSGRVDHVVPNTGDMQQSFVVFSPKLVFRNDWQGSWRGGTLSLQYSAYGLGSHVIVNGDTRLMNNPSGRPDTQMVAIFATLSW